MFDLFGIKARRRLAELEVLVKEQDQSLLKYAAVAGSANRRAEVLGKNAQELRELATTLRDRIHSHGKMETEREFIIVCEDIYKNGKLISPRRFNAMMGEIKKQRESLGLTVQRCVKAGVE